MKNISRRVFIKGMAVAAVATAASTVLTGCKLPEGVTEGEVETVVSSQVVTLKDTTKKVEFEITVKGYETVANVENMIAVPMTVINKSTAEASAIATGGFKMSPASEMDNTASKLSFGYTALFDNGVTGVEAKDITLAGNIHDKTIPAKTGTYNASLDGKLYFDTSANKDWKKLTLIFSVGEGDSGTSVDPIKQVYVVINR